MNRELIIKKCSKCGNVVHILKENDGAKLKCCDEEMRNVEANSTDASFEKHVPTYEIVEDEIFVKVNHPMEKDHYIEWIAQVTPTNYTFVKMYPEQNAECRFKYVPGATIYAYCNKHGLWKNEVK